MHQLAKCSVRRLVSRYRVLLLPHLGIPVPTAQVTPRYLTPPIITKPVRSKGWLCLQLLPGAGTDMLTRPREWLDVTPGLDQRPFMSPMLLALITNMPASNSNHGSCKSLPWRLLADTIRLSSPVSYLVILLDVTSFNGRDLVSKLDHSPVSSLDYETIMDFEQRLDSLQQLLNNVLGLFQPTSRESHRPTPDLLTSAIVCQLDELFESLNQLKEDFHLLQSSTGGGGEVTRQAHGTATHDESLVAGDVDCQNEGKDGSRNADAVFSIADMGFGLVRSLGRYGINFAGKIHISDLESFDLARISKRLADPDLDTSATLFVQHSSASQDGVSELRLSVPDLRKRPFHFPDFSDPPQPPQKYEESFENIIASPPGKPIAYYVGPPLALDFNPLLSPGKLLELGEIPGVTTPYWHAGEKDSGTAFHYEDGAIRSCNITIAGFKLWILVDISSNAKFEGFIKSLHPSAAKEPRCGQWVRHLNLLVSPQKLKEMDIRFDLVLAGPGDMVITTPGQYHAVLNLTACFAIAINFALPQDPTLSPSLVCSDCGLYELQHPAIQQLERQVSLKGARRGRPARRRHKEHRNIAQTVAQPEPTDSALGQDTQFEDTVDDAVSTDPGPETSSDAAENDSTTDDDETGNEAQTDDPALETRSQQDGDREEITLEEHDCEEIPQPGDSPSIATSSLSPPPSSASSLPASSLTPDIPSTHTSSIASFNSRSLREQQCSFQSAQAPSSTRPGLKRVANQQLSKRSRQRVSPITDGISEENQHGNVPSFDRLGSPDGISGVKLFMMVRSQHALKQFCNLVTTKRNSQLHRLFTTAQGGAAQRLATLTELRDSFKTLQYLNQYILATEIQKARGGKLRVSSEVKKEARASGLSPSQYDNHLRLGMKWRQICGAFDGILCFLPSSKETPWRIPAAEYHRIDDDQLRVFHHLLTEDYAMALCIAGKAFQQSLGGSDIYFTWETTMLSKPLYELPEDERLLYIKPVPVLLEDRFDAADFPDWPDPWIIPPTETQCYCLAQSCNCYDSKTSEARLRIMESPEKGLYLQAISEEPNAIVYKNSEVLGFLTGKLIPSGTLDNNWVFDTQKCQVDCRGESNKFKLLHHACKAHAIARLVEKRVSGRFRLAVIAQKDIYDGEEVTFLSKDKHKPCEACEHGR